MLTKSGSGVRSTARAASRSEGVRASPTRGCSRLTRCAVTPSGVLTSTLACSPAPAGSGGLSNTERRSRGVKRHSSSRPEGNGKSAGSEEIRRIALLTAGAVGSRPGAPAAIRLSGAVLI